MRTSKHIGKFGQIVGCDKGSPEHIVNSVHKEERVFEIRQDKQVDDNTEYQENFFSHLCLGLIYSRAEIIVDNDIYNQQNKKESAGLIVEEQAD